VKTRTLFVMLGLVAGAALFLLFTEDDEAKAPALNPLREIDFATLSKIRAERRDKPDWVLQRVGESWRFSSPEVAGGALVPANREVTEKIIGALRDGEPQASFQIDDETMRSYDFETPALRLALTDARGEVEIEVGRPQIDGFVGYRSAGSDTGFRVHVSIFDDLARSVSFYRDPRLLSLRFAEVEEIELQSEERGRQRLLREAGRWYLIDESGRRRAGDGNACDRYVAGVLALAGPPIAEDDPRLGDLAEGSILKIKVRARDGRRSQGSILLVDDGKQEVLMRREDEPSIRVAGRNGWRLLRRDFEELESRRLVDLDRSEIGEILIEGENRTPLHLVQKSRGAWYLRAEGMAIEPKVDQERFDVFCDFVLNMRTLSGLVSDEDFRPAWTLKFLFPKDTGSPPLTIEIEEPGADGVARARHSERPELLRLESGFALSLDTKWWELAQRFVTASNEGDITELELVDHREPAEGKLKVVKGTDAEGENIWLYGQRTVPIDFLRPLLSRLAFLSIDGFLGPIDEFPEIAQAEPRFEITWRIPTVESVKKDTLHWKIITRVDDQRWACTVDHFPGMLFLIRGEDLLPIEGALSGIRKS
jgi:Domain of unknown function (DUF4340)